MPPGVAEKELLEAAGEEAKKNPPTIVQTVVTPTGDVVTGLIADGARQGKKLSELPKTPPTEARDVDPEDALTEQDKRIEEKISTNDEKRAKIDEAETADTAVRKANAKAGFVGDKRKVNVPLYGRIDEWGRLDAIGEDGRVVDVKGREKLRKTGDGEGTGCQAKNRNYKGGEELCWRRTRQNDLRPLSGQNASYNPCGHDHVVIRNERVSFSPGILGAGNYAGEELEDGNFVVRGRVVGTRVIIDKRYMSSARIVQNKIVVAVMEMDQDPEFQEEPPELKAKKLAEYVEPPPKPPKTAGQLLGDTDVVGDSFFSKKLLNFIPTIRKKVGFFGSLEKEFCVVVSAFVSSV